MALTEIYVDPSIAANTGSGTIGDPYGDLQYALNTATRDATNGDRFNIKAGSAEVMAAAISLATYGTPTTAAPLVLQGYTAAANDGGIGEINNGGANVSVFQAGTINAVYLIDLKLGNTGTAQVVRLKDTCLLVNCEIHSSSASAALQLTAGAFVSRCVFRATLTGTTPVSITSGMLYMCTLLYGVSTSYAVLAGGSTAVRDCLFSLTGGGGGIYLSGAGSSAVGCSVYSSGGTGTGIAWVSANNKIINNIISGFSGTGGKGVLVGTAPAPVFGANAYYNNATNISGTEKVVCRLTDITLTNAPFTDAAGGDFSIATAAKAELQAQGWPSSFYGISTNQYLDPGAAQIQIPAATGGLMVHPGMTGGMRG